jgi:hypothetical protein
MTRLMPGSIELRAMRHGQINRLKKPAARPTLIYISAVRTMRATGRPPHHTRQSVQSQFGEYLGDERETNSTRISKRSCMV